MPDNIKELVRPSAETTIPDISSAAAAHVEETGETRELRIVHEKLSSVGGEGKGELTPHTPPTIDHSQFEEQKKSETTSFTPTKPAHEFGDTSSWRSKLEYKKTEMKGLKNAA